MRWILPICFFLFYNAANAQQFSNEDVEITYSNPGDLELCGSGQEYSLTLKNISATKIDSFSVVQINLPQGVELNQIETSQVNLLVGGNQPQIQLDKELAVNERFEIVLTASANCLTYGLTESGNNQEEISVANGIDFSYLIGTQNKQISQSAQEAETYNLTYAKPVVTVEQIVGGNANQTQTVETSYEEISQVVTVSMQGNVTSLEDFILEVELPDYIDAVNGSALCEVKFNGSVVDASNLTETINGKVITLNVSAVQLDIDGGFGSSEELEFKFCYQMSGCAVGDPQIISYNTLLSCNGGNCEVDSDEGSFNHIDVDANIKEYVRYDQNANLCGASSHVTYHVINTTDFPVDSVSVLMSFHSTSSVTNLTVNGVPQPHIIPSINGNRKVALHEFIQNGLPMFKDIDGDGGFSDLEARDTVFIEFDITKTFDLDPTQCNNTVSGNLYRMVTYWRANECSPISNTWGNYMSFNNMQASASTANGPADISDGETGTYSFCFARSVSGRDDAFYADDPMLFVADLNVPCGMKIASGSTPQFYLKGDYNDDTTDVAVVNTVIDGEEILQLTSAEGIIIKGMNRYTRTIQGCFVADLEYDCDEECDGLESDISYQGSMFFNECPNVVINTGCASATTYPHCSDEAPDCDPNANDPVVQLKDFDAIRTTYSWTDETMSNKISFADVESGAVTGLKTQAGYACDTIRVQMKGALHCDAINNLHSMFAYDLPSELNTTNFLSLANSELVINDGAALNVAGVSPTISGSRAMYDFDLGQSIQAGDSFEFTAFFVIDKAVVNNTTFPNIHDFGQFRGGWSTNGTFPAAPSTLGTSFEVYGLDYQTYCSSNPGNCGGIVPQYNQTSITGGTTGDDFPNEFRPLADINNIRVDFGDNALAIAANPTRSYYIVDNAYIGEMNVGVIPGTSVVLATKDFAPRYFEKEKASITLKYYIEYTPQCTFPTNDPSVSLTSDLTDSYYASSSCRTTTTDNCTGVIRFRAPEELINAPANEVLNALTNRVTFSSTITNPTVGMAISNPWVNIKFPSEFITVENSTSNPYDLNGTATYNTAQNELFIPVASISSNGALWGGFDALLVNCNQDTLIPIIIESGYSCTDIGNDPYSAEGQLTLCPADVDTVWLQLVKSNLSLDLLPYFTTSNPIEMCDEVCFMTQIFNDERANLDDPNLQVDLPDGMTLTSIEYKFPLTDDQVIQPSTFDHTTFQESGFTASSMTAGTPWDLIDQGGQSLDYLAGSLDPQWNSTNLINYYQAKVCVQTSCNYNLSDDIVFTAKGTTNCNEELAEVQRTRPIFNGIEQLSDYDPKLEFTYTESEDCNVYNVVLSVTNDNVDITSLLGSDDVLTVTTSDGQTLNLQINGQIGVQTYPFTINASSCQDMFADAVLTIATNLSCDDSGCDVNFSRFTNITIPYVDSRVRLEFRIDQNACTPSPTDSSNMNVEVRNAGGRDLYDVDVNIYCDTDNNGSFDINVDQLIATKAAPFVAAGATETVYFMVNNLEACGAGRLFAVVDRENQCSCTNTALDFAFFKCCTCDPDMKAGVELTDYDSEAGTYSFDVSSSAGNYKNIYYSTTGSNGPWTKTTLTQFTTGFTGVGPYELCVIVGNSACESEVQLPSARYIDTGNLPFLVVPDECQDTVCMTVEPLCDRIKSVTVNAPCDGEPANFNLDYEVYGSGQVFIKYSEDEGYVPVVGNTMSFVYPAMGNYTATVIVAGEYCSDTTEVPVTVRNCCRFEADIDVRGTCADEVTRFRVNVQPRSWRTRWILDFGDGEVSNRTRNRNIRHTYDTPGEYNVILTVFEKGCTTRVAQKVVIEDCCELTGDFTFGEACSGEETTFNLSKWGSNSWSHIEMFWGDGTNRTHTHSSSVKHTFEQPGDYEVMMVVYDYKCRDTITKTVTVGLCCPEEVLSLTGAIDCRGRFYGYVLGYSKTPQNVTVDWGDGTTSTGMNLNSLVHYYQAQGTYTPTVTIDWKPGCDPTVLTKQVEFAAQGLTIRKDVHPCNSLYHRFIVQDQNMTSYTWFIDGAPRGSSRVLYNIFPSVGTYTIRVEARSRYGCLYVEEFTINVEDLSVDLKIEANSTSCHLPWEFKAVSSEPLFNYQWNFGDGTTTSGGATMNHEYTTPGTYIVTVNARNARGCPVKQTIEMVIEECCECDPEMKPVVEIIGYDPISGIYTVDVSASVGEIDYIYYSTDGENGPWTTVYTDQFRVGCTSGELCVMAGANPCMDVAPEPGNDICTVIECVDLESPCKPLDLRVNRPVGCFWDTYKVELTIPNNVSIDYSVWTIDGADPKRQESGHYDFYRFKYNELGKKNVQVTYVRTDKVCGTFRETANVQFDVTNCRRGALEEEVAPIQKVDSVQSEESFDLSVVTYPNPANEYVKVSLSDGSEFENAVLRTLKGNRVQTNINSENSEAHLDVKNLEGGVYMITIYKDGNELTGRVVVAH